MNKLKLTGKAELGSWQAIFASLLPLWLFSLAVSVEGFPKPPISLGVAIAALVLAVLISVILLLKKWTTVELVLCSLFPFLLLPKFDEISTSYKTPFLFFCALTLTVGFIGYQMSFRRSRVVGWLILGIFLAGAWLLANNAAGNYWQMVGDLGYVECMPDFTGCASLTGNETPWWVLFFSL